jgi:hypothetical protein
VLKTRSFSILRATPTNQNVARHAVRQENQSALGETVVMALHARCSLLPVLSVAKTLKSRSNLAATSPFTAATAIEKYVQVDSKVKPEVTSGILHPDVTRFVLTESKQYVNFPGSGKNQKPFSCTSIIMN